MTDRAKSEGRVGGGASSKAQDMTGINIRLNDKEGRKKHPVTTEGGEHSRGRGHRVFPSSLIHSVA